MKIVKQRCMDKIIINNSALFYQTNFPHNLYIMGKQGNMLPSFTCNPISWQMMLGGNEKG